MPTLSIQSVDPRAGFLEPAPEGLEFRVATPLWGPYYQASPYLWSDLPQESFYNPRTYPFPAVNPFLPQRSGAYIQPGQADPLAYALVNEGSLEGLGQSQDQSKTIKIAVGTWLVFALGRAALGALVPRRKLRRVLRGVPKKAWGVLGVLAAGGVAWWYVTQRPDLQVSLLGRMGQADRDWFPEDPTGGGYAGAGDPVYGDVLGPGENIAVASVWSGTLKPRGFAATA